MHYELLISEDKRSYFINCTLDGDFLEVGAVYIAPSSSSPLKLYDENGATLSLTLPIDVINQPTEMVAVDMAFTVD